MVRALLVLPPLPQPMNAPYLGQQYIAAALLAAGHTVHCLDLANLSETQAAARLDDQVRAFRPDLVGMTLFTYNALAGYRLTETLAATGALLIAGGPHPTILPDEPLAHGFDLSLSGEGEHAITAVADTLEKGGDFTAIPGLHSRAGRGPPNAAIEDLDALPFPHLAAATVRLDAVAGGILTSRGCPARCTFCANYVTGRAYRWRSPENVVAEMRTLRRDFGLSHFPFWDDAFTARRPRLEALCDAILDEPELAGVTWTCITPGNMVLPRDLERMRKAGCVAINFGIESGDATILRAIQKGQTPEKILAAVQAAKAADMTTIVNFMFGFPGEGPEELANTHALMRRLAPITDFFNNFGVLVPFPGTAIYDRYHAEYGFSGWWLDPDRIPSAPAADLGRDPALEKNFFSYDPHVRDRIADLVRWKADHNAAWANRQAAANETIHVTRRIA
ncbi:B12-binding domain-containing radical SAM protein [Roseibium sediminicola]|uniref:B12-binding domain-containing radical SAM protein n=1 Tax=Roseibium sediminicola TaxID=2933272 RepID=A0ABT0H2E1_9HYPH|nr:radical SAM protein [Roseibium sp. CAU 1639]MCK7615864.1 B12-binding domain-containing radical SAM protein [Roseibium sp. CAU 1639]